jgi:hypothetical protein
MHLLEAKQELQVRLVYSGRAELERELAAGFPSLRLCKVGWLADYRDYVNSLAAEERQRFVLGFQRWRARDTILGMGEKLGEEAEIANTQACLIPRSIEKFMVELDRRRRTGEKLSFAQKKKCRQEVMQRFLQVFGNRCVNVEHLKTDKDLCFRIPFGNWVVTTYFLWGRAEAQIQYAHGIVSKGLVNQHGNPVVLDTGLSWASWVGISGATDWLYVTDEEVEPICHVLVELCGRFFDAAPKLLKGIEL